MGQLAGTVMVPVTCVCTGLFSRPDTRLRRVGMSPHALPPFGFPCRRRTGRPAAKTRCARTKRPDFPVQRAAAPAVAKSATSQPTTAAGQSSLLASGKSRDVVGWQESPRTIFCLALTIRRLLGFAAVRPLPDERQVFCRQRTFWPSQRQGLLSRYANANSQPRAGTR
jgi:hypothetical protein